MSIRPIIFSVNCYIATILTMFIAFSLDLKSPGWAMTTVYLTSQPLSGVLRAKAVYRTIGTIVGGAAMVANTYEQRCCVDCNFAASRVRPSQWARLLPLRALS